MGAPRQFLDLRTGAEPVTQAKRRVGGDRPLADDDLRNPIDGHIELPSTLGRAHVEFAQFFGEVFAGVDGGAGAQRERGT